MASVFNLPDELLLKVFSYLDVSDISLSVMYVCEHWNNIASDAVLWNKLELTVDKSMDLGYVLYLIPHLKFLKRVTLQWRTDTSDIIDALVENCPNLSGIKMICCGFIDRTCIKQLLSSYKCLKTFSLGKSWAVPSQCLQDIVLLTSLTDLNLSHCSLSPDQFRSISTSCCNITSLDIDYVRGLSEEDLILFISLRYKTLETLTVFGESLTDNIFKYFEKCLKLKQLHISTCRNISDSCFTSIEKLNLLRSLTLRRAVRFSPEVLWNFYSHSAVKRNLSHFYISAKRNVNVNDISVWLNKDSNIENIHVNQYCTCILTKDGFKVDRCIKKSE